MADQSIFNNTDKTTEEQTMNTPYVSRYVGDGKKYQTVEDMDKGLDNANNFIDQLKGEGEQLRGELDKRLNAEDMMDKIKREREELVEASQGNTTPQLDDTKLADLISSTLDVRETAKTKEGNIHIVDQKMKEIYGEKATEVLRTKATENGISLESLMNIASESPTAFYNTLGISTGKVTTPGATLSGTNTQAIQTQNSASSTETGTWSYYEALRRSNPKEYYKPSVQNQLFKMRVEKGQEAFYK